MLQLRKSVLNAGNRIVSDKQTKLVRFFSIWPAGIAMKTVEYIGLLEIIVFFPSLKIYLTVSIRGIKGTF
jgi:hypothetical protein